MRALGNTFLFGLVLLLTGCSTDSTGPAGAVSGTVSLNGQPIPDGTVHFFSETLGMGGMAPINAEGHYKMPGKLPVGDYVVSLTGPESTPDEPDPKPTLIPKKFWSPQSSKLQYTVTTGPNQFDIELSE